MTLIFATWGGDNKSEELKACVGILENSNHVLENVNKNLEEGIQKLREWQDLLPKEQ